MQLANGRGSARKAGRRLAALLLSAVAAGCDADPETAAVAETPAVPLACDHLALADSSAQPLAWVQLEGVPEGYDGPLRAELRTAADTVTSYAFTGSNDAGGHFLLTPLHPRGTIEGGAVQLRFTDGATRCPAVEFTVEPMAPAPGTFDRVVAGVQDYLRAQSAALGTTPAALRAADPDTLFPPLVPLWLAQAGLDRSGELDSLGAASRQLLDALMARTGVADSLPALVDEVDSLRSLPGFDPGGLHAVFASAGPRRTAPNLASAAPASIFSFAAVRPALPQPPSPVANPTFTISAGTLDLYMSLAMSASIATTGRARDIYGLFTGSLAVTSMLIKATLIEGADMAFAAMGTTAFIYEQTAVAAAKLLPRRFTNLTVDLDKAVFAEDDEVPGSWDHAVATAVSEGWQLDEAALQTLLRISKMKKAGGITVKSRWLDRMSDGEARTLLYGLRGFLANGTLGRLIGETAGEGGPLQLGPYTFAADISAPEWHEVNYTGPAVQAVRGSKGKRYEPINVGRSTLTISTPPKKFGFQLIRRDERIVVEPIVVEISPPRVFVGLREVVQFTVTVSNALDGSMQFEATAGDLMDEAHSSGRPGEHVWRISLESPDSPDAFPVRLNAISTADRSHLTTARERSARARIEIYQLEVFPDTACIRPGERQQFTALLAGKPSAKVRWDASAGSISQAGEFQPPGGSGTATITAFHADDRDVERGVDVRFGEQCEMYWKASVGTGPHTGEFVGSKGKATITDRMTVTLTSEPDARPFVLVTMGVELDELGAPLKVGQCAVEVAFSPSGNFYEDMKRDRHSNVCSGASEPPRRSVQDVNPNYSWPYPAPATVQIQRVGDGFVEGWAEGQFYRGHPYPADPAEQGAVRIEFRVPIVCMGRSTC